MDDVQNNERPRDISNIYKLAVLYKNIILGKPKVVVHHLRETKIGGASS